MRSDLPAPPSLAAAASADRGYGSLQTWGLTFGALVVGVVAVVFACPAAPPAGSAGTAGTPGTPGRLGALAEAPAGAERALEASKPGADAELAGAPELAVARDAAREAERGPEAELARGPAPVRDWSLRAGDYELRFTDAQGQESVRTLRLDAGAEAAQLQLQGEESWRLPLAARGAQDAGSRLGERLRLLLDQVQAGPNQTLRLPDGGWIEAKRTAEALEPETHAGKATRGTQTTAKLRGVTRSGERFQGQLKAELWLGAEAGELVALRVKESLEFSDQGTRSIAFSLRPLTQGTEAPGTEIREPKVGALPRAPEGAREVASAAPLGTRPAEAAPWLLFVSGLLGLILFSLLVRWLGLSGALCVFLALSIVALPLLARAQEKASWTQRFSDPTENEVGVTLVAGLLVGVGAAFAAVSAPVWVPIAVGAAGVTAIGAYWFTRTPPIRKGEIVDKRFEPDRTYLTYVPMTVFDSEGKATTVMIPKVVHDDADYVLKIQSGAESSKVYVTAEQFAALEVGQTFDMDTMGGNRFDDHDERRATAAEQARLEAAKARGEESVSLEGAAGALRREASQRD